MIRAFLITVLIALCVAAAGTITVKAHASPVPDEAESDCSWNQNGVTIVVGGVEFKCLCALLTGPAGKRVLCRLYRVDRLPKEPKKKPAPPKKKPRPKPKPKPKPALIHAPLPQVIA